MGQVGHRRLIFETMGCLTHSRTTSLAHVCVCFVVNQSPTVSPCSKQLLDTHTDMHIKTRAWLFNGTANINQETLHKLFFNISL